MGPLNNTLVHFSFGRTGLFSVLIDSASRENKQAGVLFIDANYTAPVLKGAIHPKDGQLYTAGFNLWGSNSTGISAIGRLRYTGRKYQLPTGFQVGKEGLVLHFSEELERESVKDLSNFVIKRWNYQRSARYGSGHYLLNGSPGEETLPILQSHLSADKKSLLLLIANMEEVMQMQLRYAIESKENIPLVDVFSFSVNRLNSLHLQPQFFPSLDLEKVNLQLTAEQLIEARPKDQEISKEKGETLFKQFACLGCHSTTDRTEGMYGTPFGNLFLSKREFKDGSSALADEQYLRESILSPNKQIVKGYGDEMPSFSGILSPSDVESLILYIKTL